MPRPSKSYPTELELEILKIHWSEGPLPVSAVRSALAEGPAKRRCAHTSVITTLNTMVGKGYLNRRAQGKAYVYAAQAQEKTTKKRMLADLMHRAFDGSASALVLNLIETGGLDENELKRIRQAIDKSKESSK